MKYAAMMILASMVFITGCASTRSDGPIGFEHSGAPPMTPSGVSITPDGHGGTEVMAQVDLAEVVTRPAVKEAPLLAKPFIAAKDVIVSAAVYTKENPGTVALGLAATYVTVRTIQGKIGDDVQDLLGRSSSSSSSTSNQTDQNAELTVSGSNNFVTQNITITPPPVFVTNPDKE